MNRPSAWFAVGILAVAVGAAALRLPRLALRPMHGDEANQAVKAGILFETGTYRYDPREHHGPTLYYATLPSWWMSGAGTFAETGEATFRIVPVVFGIAAILLLALVGDGLGRAAAVVAGGLAAASAPMVYYSRYYIQETLLVFFTFAAIACGWRFVRSGSAWWAAAAGAAIGLMHATKETWVLAGAAMAAGLALAAFWSRLTDGAWPAAGEWLRARRGGLAVAAAAAAVVAAGLFSSFGANLRGPLDSILAYRAYLGRAGGDGLHAQPWYFYLQMLIADRPARGFFWTEGLVVGLALAGTVAALSRGGLPAEHRPLARFLAFYTVVLTALYAAIPYKTPWCMLSFLHGLILLAGVGAVAIVRLVRRLPLRVAACVVLAAAGVHFVRQSYLLNYKFQADQRNPYFYAHPTGDVLNLADLMERLARAAPDGRNMMIHVVTPENYWPLPWYLRRFNPDHVGYWHDAAAWAADAGRVPAPAVVILTADVEETVNSTLRGPYNRQSKFGLRPGVILSVFVREDVWDAMLAGVASPDSSAGDGDRGRT